MSRTSTWIVGLFALSCGIGSAALAVLSPTVPERPNVRWAMGGFCAFCVLITLVCLAPKTRPVTVRLIGATIFAACGGYVYSQICAAISSGPLSALSLLEITLALVAFGLPAGHATITGRYPKWGIEADVFNRS